MNKFIMRLVIACGVITLGFRFLPHAQQQQLLTQIPQAAGGSNVLPAAAPQPKKYKLVAFDEAAPQPDNILDRNEHAQRSQLPLVASAYIQHLENIQVQGEGRVIKVLPDDTNGNKHQRFLVRTDENVTVLIAHNISLAPRIKDLAMGDRVSFVGEYLWNEKGGLVHWTHNDPRGQHAAGWIQRDGMTYR